MADLDFKHNVSEIPAGQRLEAYKGEDVKADVSRIPDFQGALTEYGANTNWMSSLGSSVAAKASNAIATQLGGEAGKHPKGDLWPSITDFDKQFAESYKTQAQSTLGLQANQLITNSNIEMSKATRITPELIASTNKQVSMGLQNIFQNAPAEIRPSMEYQYGSLALQQGEHLANRMLGEQKEDRQNNLELATKKNTENVYALQLSSNDLDKDGNSKAALKAEEAIRKGYDSAVGMRDKTPQERQIAIDSARQSRLSAKYIRKGLEDQKAGTEEQFRKSLADSPPSDVSAADHATVYNNVISYLNNQNALRASDENLKSQLMYNKIIGGEAISGTEWAAFEKSVSPLQAAKMQFRLLQSQNKKDTKSDGINNLILNYGDSRAHAEASPEVQNGAYLKQVDTSMKQDPNQTRTEAEVQVAMSSPVPPPVLTKMLQDGLWSGDAAQMIEKTKQIEALQATGNGHALTGLSESDLALASDIGYNYNPADPASAARIITENRENQDPKLRNASTEVFNNMIYDGARKNGITNDDFVLGKFGLTGGVFSSAAFDSPWLKSKYATDIMSVYQTNFINTRRDDVRATKLTQDYIANNYDKTFINGTSEFAKHPLEKALGFEPGVGIDSINKDIIRQISEPLKVLKDSYDKKTSDTYWSVEPLSNGTKTSKVITSPSSLSPIFGPTDIAINLATNKKSNSNRLQFVKHTRNGSSTDTESFPLKMVGNNFNWELNVETKDGPMSIFLRAPEIGVHQYTPDRQWIQNDYLGNYQSFPKMKYTKQITSNLELPNEGNQ